MSAKSVPKENLPPANYQPGDDPDNQMGDEALKAAPMQQMKIPNEVVEVDDSGNEGYLDKLEAEK